MDKTKLLQRLTATFLEELQENLRVLNRELLALEKGPGQPERAERLQQLFRIAHSLKGAARSVNVGLIEGACHRWEDILAGVRDGRIEMGHDLFQLLFASLDGMEEAGMRLREQQDLSDAPLAGLLWRLESAAAGKAAPAADPIPSPTPAVKLSEPTPHGGAVRVAAEKLDFLLAECGELLVARRRVEARIRDLSAVQELARQGHVAGRHLEFEVRGCVGMPAKTAKRIEQLVLQNRSHLARLEKELDRLGSGMTGDARLLKQVAAPLDDSVRAIRMLPIAEACAGLERLARDVAEAQGKIVALHIEGDSLELDRSILEGLGDPLRHLVRNAVDHGVEAPAIRRQKGKPGKARIEVRAALRGALVEVTVQDDGAGLDLEALREQAHRRQIPEPANDRDLAQLIFLPGLSTARIITEISGRGVGLDVVKSRVEALHGSVDVACEPGAGTRFTLRVPLTLTTMRAVLFQAGGRPYAVASVHVQQLLRVDPSELRTVGGRDMLPLADAPTPFVFLSALLQPEVAVARPAGRVPVLIVKAGDQRLAVAVDELISEQEITLKNLGRRIRRVPWVAGATLLPSGAIALVLNAPHLIRAGLSRGAARAAPLAAPISTTKKRLLVVEDSMTTRILQKSILEAAGYEVDTAVDGRDAWKFLQDHKVDLIVSDVEMPHMDGFELTRAVRAAKLWRDLPVVLVTSRESEEDRLRGLEAGAHAYIVKGAFDQRDLLRTIAQLV